MAADETRQLLKLFGVTVTDFEDEAGRLAEAADRLSGAGAAEPLARLLKDLTELCCEMNSRWLRTTQLVFDIQTRLLSRCAEAANRLLPESPPGERGARAP